MTCNSGTYDSGRSVAPTLFVLAVIIVALTGLALAQLAPMVQSPDIPMIDPASHAGAKHGSEAYEAINTVNKSRYCRWDCTDGRERYVCAGNNNLWAIVVTEGAKVITAFMSTQEYAHNVTERPGCSNPWRLAH